MKSYYVKTEHGKQSFTESKEAAINYAKVLEALGRKPVVIEVTTYESVVEYAN